MSGSYTDDANEEGSFSTCYGNDGDRFSCQDNGCHYHEHTEICRPLDILGYDMSAKCNEYLCSAEISAGSNIEVSVSHTTSIAGVEITTTVTASAEAHVGAYAEAGVPKDSYGVTATVGAGAGVSATLSVRQKYETDYGDYEAGAYVSAYADYSASASGTAYVNEDGNWQLSKKAMAEAGYGVGAGGDVQADYEIVRASAGAGVSIGYQAGAGFDEGFDMQDGVMTFDMTVKFKVIGGIELNIAFVIDFKKWWRRDI